MISRGKARPWSLDYVKIWNLHWSPVSKFQLTGETLIDPELEMLENPNA